MKISHITTGLKNGGAEQNLYKICINDKHNKHSVISLSGTGKYAKLLKKKGIKVSCVNMKKGFFSIFQFIDLVQQLKKTSPNLVQTWMYHGDFFGSLAALIIGCKNIIWNIRNSNIKNSNFKIRFIIWLLSKFSWFVPKKIISCSKVALDTHVKLGYYSKKISYIPNGYDFRYLKPIKKADLIKKKFKIKKSIPIIGMVARFHPQKDHVNLIRSLSFLTKKNINFLCILIGPGIKNQNRILINIIKKYKMEKFIKLFGETNQIREILSELDIHVLSSAYGEAFPNVLVESMACETPCVVTDVGDSKYIVNKFGWVAKPCDYLELSKKIKQALDELKQKNWKKKCKKARFYVLRKFSISKTLFKYNEIWNKALKNNC